MRRLAIVLLAFAALTTAAAETGKLAVTDIFNLELATDPQTSPDGHWISFTAHVAEEPPSLIKMPQKPEGAEWAAAPKVIDNLVYRFNGEGYLKPGYTQLFVVPAEGGAARQISTGKFQHGGAAWRASEAVWTPDSKYLIMAANRR